MRLQIEKTSEGVVITLTKVGEKTPLTALLTAPEIKGLIQMLELSQKTEKFRMELDVG